MIINFLDSHSMSINNDLDFSPLEKLGVYNAYSVTNDDDIVSFSKDSEIIITLKLDDYINNTFEKENNQVSLYIGHYNTAKKVGAAHDPTVCFPGQGWILSDKIKGTYQFKSDKEYSIPYSMMIAQRGEYKQLIIYWFQSHDIANSNTLSQKFTLIWNRFLHKGESNAFVRVIMPLKGKTVTECKTTILDFITNFYPIYIGYITKYD